jgi:hypothetical protein
MEFKLVEKPDIEKLGCALMSNYISSEDILGYFIYYQKLLQSTDGSVTVTYKQRKYNGVPYGRFYPENSKMTSCTTMWSAVRSEVFGDVDTDIDIVNCSPSALLEICKQSKIHCKELEGYVTNRDYYIEDLNISDDTVNNYNNLTQSCCSKRELGKFVFTALLYGSGDVKIQQKLKTSTSVFKRTGPAARFKKEIKELSTSVTSLPKYKKLCSDITAELAKSKEKPHPGQLLSFILQEAERAAVQRAINIFQQRGFTISSYIYDGFHVNSKDEPAIEDVLDEINKGQSLKFIIKPFKEPLSQLERDGHFTIEARDDDETRADWEKYAEVNAEGFETAKDRKVVHDELVANNDLEAANIVLEHCGDKFVKTGPSAEMCYVLVDNRWQQGTEPLLKMIMELQIKKLNKDDVLVTYSENVSHAKNIKEAVIAIADTDTEFVYRTNYSIRDYLFYKNCIYSLRERKFFSYDECKLRPFFIIDQEIDKKILPLNDVRMVELKEKIFCCFQNDEEIEYYLRAVSRGMFGHVEDKVFYPVIGSRDSGKGTLEALLAAAFGRYVARANLPIAKSSVSDPASDNRAVLTLNQNLARIAIANEGKTVGGKPAIIDGNYIKSVVASGGDKVVARMMYGNEVETKVNCVFFFNLNEVPRCEPANAMEKARVIYTSLKFGDTEVGEFTAGIRKSDPGIKDWISNTPWIAQAMLSYIVHYFTDTSAFKLTQPESFKVEQQELIPNDSDLSSVLNNYFKKDPESLVLVTEVRDRFAGCGKTDSQLTRWLDKNGITKVKASSKNEKGERPYYYKGISFKIRDNDESMAETCLI